MWWDVTQLSKKEVHVYPSEEAHEHILDAELCNCLPDVKEAAGNRMVVHRKIHNEPIVVLDADGVK